MTIYGDNNSLTELAELFTGNVKVMQIIKNIKNIVKSLPSGTDYIIDVSDVDCYEYHSGLIFSAYSAKYTSALAKGGVLKILLQASVKRGQRLGLHLTCEGSYLLGNL